MKFFIKPLLAIGLVMCAGSTLCSQTDDPNQKNDGASKAEKPADEIEEFEDKYNKRYLKDDPTLGTSISNLNGFDEQGKPFDFESTNGKHTVVVFGCLT